MPAWYWIKGIDTYYDIETGQGTTFILDPMRGMNDSRSMSIMFSNMSSAIPIHTLLLFLHMSVLLTSERVGIVLDVLDPIQGGTKSKNL